MNTDDDYNPQRGSSRVNWLKVVAALMMVGGLLLGLGMAAVHDDQERLVPGSLIIGGFVLFVIARFLD